MFEASLNQMALASEDLRKISKELNSCLSDTYGPSGFLQDLYYMENPLRLIKRYSYRCMRRLPRRYRCG